MAVSSTTTTLCIPSNNIPTTQAPKFGFSSTIYFTVKPRRICIRSSGDVSAETTATEVDSESSSGDVSAETTATEVDSESSIEVPEEPYSLISALNVERALRGIPITDADHYGRLGIARGCPFDKVAVAYNNKVREVKSQGLEEEELNKKLELLKESYTILSSEDERRIYDWSLARAENTDKYVWPFEVDITQIPKGGDPPPQEPEDVEPTRLVGYFLLAWVMLSFVLSIGLNLQ